MWPGRQSPKRTWAIATNAFCMRFLSSLMLVFASGLVNSTAWFWGSIWSEAQAMSSPLSLSLSREMSLFPKAMSCLSRVPSRQAFCTAGCRHTLQDIHSALRKGLLVGLLGQGLSFVNPEADRESPPFTLRGWKPWKANAFDIMN